MIIQLLLNNLPITLSLELNPNLLKFRRDLNSIQRLPMLSSIFSMLPTILTVFASAFMAWFICKLWFKMRYIHKDEVRPLQESQHIMQNQYAILAERIKNTEQQLIEAKAKLEIALAEQKENLVKIAEFEAASQGQAQFSFHESWDTLKDSLTEEFKKCLLENSVTAGEDETEAFKTKEQLNAIRQALKEFKTETFQKFNSSTNQYQELSARLVQMIDLNKKLLEETSTLNKSLTENEQQPDRQFLLTSIKKRS